MTEFTRGQAPMGRARRVPFDRCLRRAESRVLARWVLYLHRVGEPQGGLDAADLAVARRALSREYQGRADPARAVAALLAECADFVRAELEVLCR